MPLTELHRYKGLSPRHVSYNTIYINKRSLKIHESKIYLPCEIIISYTQHNVKHYTKLFSFSLFPANHNDKILQIIPHSFKFAAMSQSNPLRLGLLGQLFKVSYFGDYALIYL